MSDENFTIQIEGLEPVLRKFQNAPKTINKNIRKTMEASLQEIHGSVPAYPPQRTNMVRPYTRTGALGKSIGVTMSGAKAGKPTVYSISGSGGNTQGRFGTNLSYAKYVIGDTTQAKIHKGWWWDMSFVMQRAKNKVIDLWNRFINRSLNA